MHDAVNTAVFAANQLAEQLYNRIKDDIFNFRLLPGDHFTESSMAAQVGVSRTPLNFHRFSARLH